MDRMIYTLSYDTKQNHRARVFLCFLLVFCIVGSCMAQPVESHASATLTGLAVGGVVALTLGAILLGSGVPLDEENTVPLVNALYWGMDAEQRAIVESFNTGQAIGDLYNAVSSWLYSVVDGLGNIFFDQSTDSSFVYPKLTFTESGYLEFSEPFICNALETKSFLGLETAWDSNIRLNDGIRTTIGGFKVGTDGTMLYLAGTYDSGAFIFKGFQFRSWNGDLLLYPYCSYVAWDGSNWVECDNGYAWSLYNPIDHPDKWKSYDLLSPQLYWYALSVYQGSVSEHFEGLSSSVSVEYLPTSTDTDKALTTITPVYVPQTWEQLWDSTPQDIRTGTFSESGSGTVTPDLPLEGSTSGTITGTGTGTGVFGDTGSWIWDIPILGNILALLNQIWSIVQNLFTSIIGSIVSALQNFFLPTEEQFVGFVEDLHNTVDSSGFPTLDSALGFSPEQRPDNISISVYGKEVDVVPFDLVDYALEHYFRPIIRGLIWFLLTFYEVNQFSILFTGRRMFDLASAFGNSKEDGDSKQRKGLVKV